MIFGNCTWWSVEMCNFFLLFSENWFFKLNIFSKNPKLWKWAKNWWHGQELRKFESLLKKKVIIINSCPKKPKHKKKEIQEVRGTPVWVYREKFYIDFLSQIFFLKKFSGWLCKEMFSPHFSTKKRCSKWRFPLAKTVNLAVWAFSLNFLYSHYYLHPLGPLCKKIITVLGLFPSVTFAHQNVGLICNLNIFWHWLVMLFFPKLSLFGRHFFLAKLFSSGQAYFSLGGIFLSGRHILTWIMHNPLSPCPANHTLSS